MRCKTCLALSVDEKNRFYCILGWFEQGETGFSKGEGSCGRRSIEKIVRELDEIAELRAEYFSNSGEGKKCFNSLLWNDNVEEG